MKKINKAKHSLKSKLAIHFLLTILVSFITLYFIFQKITIQDFSKIEKLFFQLEIKNFAEEMKLIEDNIDDIAIEWAYDINIDRNLKEDFSKRSLEGLLSLLEIDGMFILQNKKVIFFKSKSSIKEEAYLLAESLKNIKSEKRGFFNVKGLPVILSIRKIKSHNSFIVVFKFFDSEFLKKISDGELIKLTFQPLNIENKTYIDRKTIDKFIVKFYEINHFLFGIEIIAKDINGDYFLLSNAIADRIIKKELVKTLAILVFSVIILLLILGISLIRFINKHQITPVHQIERFLDESIEKKDFSKRLTIEFSTAEFQHLEMIINLLFETIEKQINTIKEQNELFKTISENLPAVIYIFREKFEYVSPKVKEILEIDPQELKNLSIREFIKRVKLEGITEEELINSIRRRLKGERFTNKFFFHIRTKSGKEKYLMVISNTVFIDNQPYGLGIAFDLTERKELEKKLEELALTDPLTGLLNRNGFFRKVDTLINIYQREEKEFFILLFDLNKFKFINDQYGHNTGDLLLKTIGKRLKEVFRKSDILARLGGDEFAIVIPTLSKEEDIVKVLEKLVKAIEEPIKIDGVRIKPTTSIGIAVFPKDGTDINTLLKRADIAMYRAKELSRKSGKSEFVFFSEEFEKQIKRKLEIERELEKALISENGELQVFYQPIVDRDKNIVKLEALMRWESEKFGRVSPVEFIEVAEESGLITRLTDFLLKTVNKDLEKWKHINEKIKVSVNISPIDIKDPLFLDRLEVLIKDNKKRITIEITENVFLEGSVRVREVLQKLVENDIEISLDDFGTGYSSLVYLRKFPVNILKIDKSFTQNVDASAEDRNIVMTIVKLAQILGIKTVAEGVEKLDQFYFLRDIKVDFYQGYLFGKPAPAEEIEQLLKAGKVDINGV